MKNLFKAVNYVHDQKMVHRNIKPENIMVTKDDGSIKLIDFGVCMASKLRQRPYTNIGTPYYMAPEAIKGVFGSQADIWSLGVLLYTLVSGYLPFQGDNNDEIFGKILHAEFHFDH